jgi:hypothetical protein
MDWSRCLWYVQIIENVLSDKESRNRHSVDSGTATPPGVFIVRFEEETISESQPVRKEYCGPPAFMLLESGKKIHATLIWSKWAWRFVFIESRKAVDSVAVHFVTEKYTELTLSRYSTQIRPAWRSTTIPIMMMMMMIHRLSYRVLAFKAMVLN